MTSDEQIPDKPNTKPSPSELDAMEATAYARTYFPDHTLNEFEVDFGIEAMVQEARRKGLSLHTVTLRLLWNALLIRVNNDEDVESVRDFTDFTMRFAKWCLAHYECTHGQVSEDDWPADWPEEWRGEIFGMFRDPED